MKTERIFPPCVAILGVYEHIEVYLVENEQEVWFLTLANDSAIHFFMQSMMQNNTFFPDGRVCVLKAYDPDVDGEVGQSRFVKQHGTLEVISAAGVFTKLEAIKYATCPLCQGEAMLLTDIAEVEPKTDDGGKILYYCQACLNVVTP